MIQSKRWLLPGVNVRVLSDKSTNQIIKLLPKLDNLSDFTQAHTVTDGYIEVLFSRKKMLSSLQETLQTTRKWILRTDHNSMEDVPEFLVRYFGHLISVSKKQSQQNNHTYVTIAVKF